MRTTAAGAFALVLAFTPATAVASDPPASGIAMASVPRVVINPADAQPTADVLPARTDRSGDPPVSAGAGYRRIAAGTAGEGGGEVALRLRGLDRNGEPKVNTYVTVINLRNVNAPPADPVFMQDGKASLRVPRGHYAITAAIFTESDGDPDPDAIESVSITTVADQTVSQDTEVVLDARLAQPISAAVAGVASKPVDLDLYVAVRDATRSGHVVLFDASPEDVEDGKLFVQPTERARHGRMEASSKWRLNSADASYDLLFAGPRFPRSLQYVVEPRHLARVRTTYRVPGLPIGYLDARYVFTEINPTSTAIAQPVAGTPPLRRTEYVLPVRHGQWFQCVYLLHEMQQIGDFCEPRSRPRPGRRTEHAWLRAPLRSSAASFRTPTAIQFGVTDLGEDAPHSGSVASHLLTRSYRLYRNGALLASGRDPFGIHQVPAGNAVFRLERVIEQAILPLSQRVESSWTFEAPPPRGEVASADPPLIDVAVHVPVDERNQVSADRRLGLQVEAVHQTKKAPRIRLARLEVSTDDGRTWRKVRLDQSGRGRFQGHLAAGTLSSGSHVSLRAVVADTGGNHTKQTILRAFSAR